jgi:hypothetical protein
LKKVYITLLILILLFLIPTYAIAELKPITVYVDGQQVQFEVTPVIQDGTTLVPFRQIFEKLGLKVLWDENTQTVTGSKDGLIVQLQIGSKEAKVNVTSSTLEIAPKIIQGNTFVPLRFVSESLGKEVIWDGQTNAIRIGDKPEKFVSDDLNITDTSSKSTVGIGMTKEEVEQRIGISKDVNFLNIYNYNGLQIFYRDNKVAGIIINSSKNATNKYQTNRNLILGNNVDDVQSKYGNGLVDEKFNAVTYLFLKEKNGEIKKVDDRDSIKENANAYVISFSYFKSTKNIST